MAVESLAAGGSGVTHLADGMIAFVPRTAPGDRATLTGIKRHKRHATARLGELLEPSPVRVEPPCEHYRRDHCGGCQWQHIAYQAQLASKARIVGDALRRIGSLDVADPVVIASPRQFGYRTSITLTVRREGARVWAGFHSERDPAVVFPLEFCHIARPELMTLWGAARRQLDAAPRGDDVRLRLRLAADGSAVTSYAAEPFGQVNAEVAEFLRERVVDEAHRRTGAQARGRILDLYAGAGDTAIPLAKGHDVIMVEMDARAVRQAEESAREQGITLTCRTGRVEDHLGRLLPAEVVIVNPPRTGLSEQVVVSLSARPPGRLLYVSCDPATLARDLKRMNVTGDRLSLTAFDMFPQTSHVETLAVVG